MTEVTDPIGGKTKFNYDAFGNLIKTIDPSNNEIIVDYDSLGRKTALKDPDLGYISYKVNPLGQTWVQISPNQRKVGQQTRFVFDLLGRMTGRYEPDLESHWIYDSAANGKGQLAESYTGTESMQCSVHRSELPIFSALVFFLKSKCSFLSRLNALK